MGGQVSYTCSCSLAPGIDEFEVSQSDPSDSSTDSDSSVDDEITTTNSTGTSVPGATPPSESTAASGIRIPHSDFTASPESQVLRLNSDKLVTAIKAIDPLSLAFTLYAEGLIEIDTRDTCLLDRTPQQKAGIIVSAIERRVEADPSLYQLFTTLLQKEGDSVLKSLSRKLQQEYKSILTSYHIPHQSSSSQPQSPVCLYANNLRAIYAESKFPKFSNPACYKWTPSCSKKYIDLTVINKKVITTKQVHEYKREATLSGKITKKSFISAIKFEEILQAQPDEKLQCVLIEGAPGVGKSTLAWQVCHRWGKGELFQQYSIVLLLPLRDHRVQGATCVEDFFISTNRDLQERVHREVNQKNWDGKDSLIILEGLDELPSHLLSQPSIFTALLSGTELHQATILVTSRPSATEQLLTHYSQRISMRFEISGFTKKRIKEYTQSVLLDREQRSGFNKYLSIRPHIKSMMYVPLHCAIAVTVYLQCQQSCTPPPQTLTKLYTCFIQTILIQYLKDHSHVQYTGGDYTSLDTVFDIRIPRPVYKNFKDLCRIAFGHVKDQQLVFPSLPIELHDLGFTDAVPEFLLYQQSASSSYNFLHLSVQEFLAAYHISLMNFSEQEEFLKTMSHESHFKNTLQFVAGITKFNGLNERVVKQAIGIVHRMSPPKVVYTLSFLPHIEQFSSMLTISCPLGNCSLGLLYECQNVSFLDSGSTYFISASHNWPSYLFLALGYCIANSSCGWYVTLLGLSHKQAEMILQGLRENEKCQTSYRISIVGKQCSTEFIDTLFSHHVSENLIACIELLIGIYTPNMLKLYPRMKRLNTLNLEKLEIPDNLLKELLQVLSSIPTLRNLEPPKLNSEGIALLCQWLPSCQLETLRLPYLSPDHIEMVSTSLATVSSLKKLDISKSKLTFQSVQAFVSMLRQNQSLTELIIYHSSIDSDNTYCYLVETIHRSTKIKKLIISIKHVEKKGVLAMAEMLKHNTILVELNLCSAKICENGAVTIAEALHLNTALRKLTMSVNSVGNRGALAMAKMLRYTTVLEELKLEHTHIDSDGAVEIARALNHNTTLRKLDMSRNPVEEEGVLAMAEALCYNTTLKSLNIITHHRIGEREILAMAEMLKHNTTLEELYLERSKDDEYMEILARSLAVNQSLKTLTISTFSNRVDAVKVLAVFQDYKERVDTLESECTIL